jgi:hypothetical protein
MMSGPAARSSEALGEARITAVYHVGGSEKEARAKAELICIDQTVEASEEVLTPDLRERIVGRIEELRPLSPDRYDVSITYRGRFDWSRLRRPAQCAVRHEQPPFRHPVDVV